MEKYQVIIEELNNIDADWKIKVCENQKLEEIKNYELLQKIDELIGIIRQYKKKSDAESLEDIAQMIDAQSVIELLNQYVENSLVYFNTLSELREIERGNSEKVKEFLQDVIENYIVRVDMQIAKRFQTYNFKSEKSMVETYRAIDHLTEYYVRKLYVKSNIEEDFCEETGLSKESCQLYAELIDKYFQEIKMNIIMQGLECYRNN